MRWAILWIGKSDSGATSQSLAPLFGWSKFQKKEELESVGELSEVCSQIVFKCLYLARIGVNKLARSVTKWTQACDRRPARLIYYITQTISDNIAMWDTRHSIASFFFFFKTPTLLVISKTQSQLQDVSCAFLEVKHLYQWAGCARNRLQFHIVQQNQKLFHWMLYFEWTGHLLLLFGVLWLRFYVQIQETSNAKSQALGNGKRLQNPKPRPNVLKKVERLINWVKSITCPQTHGFLRVCPSCTFSKIAKLWSKWSSKNEVQRWDTCPALTELLLTGCLTETSWNPWFKSNKLTSRTNSLIFWPKEVSREMSGIIFSVCSTSWIFRRILPANTQVFFSNERAVWSPCRNEDRYMEIALVVWLSKTEHEYFSKGFQHHAPKVTLKKIWQCQQQPQPQQQHSTSSTDVLITLDKKAEKKHWDGAEQTWADYIWYGEGCSSQKMEWSQTHS